MLLIRCCIMLLKGTIELAFIAVRLFLLCKESSTHLRRRRYLNCIVHSIYFSQIILILSFNCPRTHFLLHWRLFFRALSYTIVCEIAILLLLYWAEYEGRLLRQRVVGSQLLRISTNILIASLKEYFRSMISWATDQRGIQRLWKSSLDLCLVRLYRRWRKRIAWTWIIRLCKLWQLIECLWRGCKLVL